MHPGLCVKKLDWAASPSEASGGGVAFCVHGFYANPVSLVSAVMSASGRCSMQHRLTRILVCAVIARPQSSVADFARKELRSQLAKSAPAVCLARQKEG